MLETFSSDHVQAIVAVHVVTIHVLHRVRKNRAPAPVLDNGVCWPLILFVGRHDVKILISTQVAQGKSHVQRHNLPFSVVVDVIRRWAILVRRPLSNSIINSVRFT